MLILGIQPRILFMDTAASAAHRSLTTIVEVMRRPLADLVLIANWPEASLART